MSLLRFINAICGCQKIKLVCCTLFTVLHPSCSVTNKQELMFVSVMKYLVG